MELLLWRCDVSSTASSDGRQTTAGDKDPEQKVQPGHGPGGGSERIPTNTLKNPDDLRCYSKGNLLVGPEQQRFNESSRRTRGSGGSKILGGDVLCVLLDRDTITVGDHTHQIAHQDVESFHGEFGNTDDHRMDFWEWKMKKCFRSSNEAEEVFKVKKKMC